MAAHLMEVIIIGTVITQVSCPIPVIINLVSCGVQLGAFIIAILYSCGKEKIELGCHTNYTVIQQPSFVSIICLPSTRLSIIHLTLNPLPRRPPSPV